MLAEALKLLRHPVPPEKQALLKRRWESLDPGLRLPGQGYGRQATGCGATIGVQPRCDFACTGCYLGEEANRAHPRPREEIFRQLDLLREHLGPKGNVQITDGEVTLLPREDLLAILRHARGLGLIPMLMTHGDTFRRRPSLLPRLVSEGGLREVALHVDSTQRGRRGARGGESEQELMPLRGELAGMIRRVRRQTGVRLRVATTLTISRENLHGVGSVVDWCFRHRDVFGFVSFQPLARVGRTLPGLEGVESEALWRRVHAALAPHGLRRHQPPPLFFGHPACSRMESLLVVELPGEAPRAVPILREGSREDEEMVSSWFARGLGGATFRDDTLLQRLCRGVGVLAKDPRWILGPARRWASRRIAELGTTAPRLAAAVALGRARLDSFTVASHHFMSPGELATPLGRERLAACVFQVPVGDRMVSMCEVNGLGHRERIYAGLQGRLDSGRPEEKRPGEAA